MKKIFVIVCFITATSLFAQKGKQQLMLELSCNMPVIANSSSINYSTSSVNTSIAAPFKSNTDISEKLGVGFRATYGMPVIGDISASAGIGLDYLAYSIHITEYPIYPSANELFMLNQPLNRTRVLYLGIPLIAKYSLLSEKLTVQLGLITNFLLFNNQKITSSSIINNRTVTSTFNSSDGMYKIVSLIETGVSYTIIDNIGVNIKFQRALTPIFERNYLSSGLMHYNIFSLGVSYNLF